MVRMSYVNNTMPYIIKRIMGNQNCRMPLTGKRVRRGNSQYRLVRATNDTKLELLRRYIASLCHSLIVSAVERTPMCAPVVIFG
jgi:hypothetical protein